MTTETLDNCWALILAAGEGSRLRSLTTLSTGVSIPKQFWSLRGGMSLLQAALQRAESIASRQHICAIVAAQHRIWWQNSLSSLPARNVIVQPKNCGTASGILLPLLQIMQMDNDAIIVILPSDHHVDNESILTRGLHDAVSSIEKHRDRVFLLGMHPDEPDTELGYIVPGVWSSDGTADVLRFVEKPPIELAEALIRQGALWNAFILAGRAAALLELFKRNAPKLFLRMRAALHESSTDTRPEAIDSLYRTLTTQDFSRHIFSGQESHLRVVRVPSCGWSDLGTPKRVADTLRRLVRAGPQRFDVGQDAGGLSLASQQGSSRMPINVGR